jgi:class 3 adenylate cyclase
MEQETPAEYKQVTVLFADVVHSMDIAAAVGAERLREIMADLADRCAAVVQRYGSTVAQWTGDGIMAVFGAPVALEDDAVRACLAALGIQQEAKRLAVDVGERDAIDLRLRVGLNSGEVIAGEMGSGPFGYATVGEQVGMAQRMVSVAPPGGVMLSASTARLVEHTAVLSEPEMVHIKGSDQPVAAQRLLGVPERDRRVAGAESTLVGRRWEMAAIEALLDLAIDGHGAVVGIRGRRLASEAQLCAEEFIRMVKRRRPVWMRSIADMATVAKFNKLWTRDWWKWATEDPDRAHEIFGSEGDMDAEIAGNQKSNRQVALRDKFASDYTHLIYSADRATAAHYLPGWDGQKVEAWRFDVAARYWFDMTTGRGSAGYSGLVQTMRDWIGSRVDMQSATDDPADFGSFGLRKRHQAKFVATGLEVLWHTPS